MSVVALIKSAAAKAINDLYQLQLNDDDIQVNSTKPEFEGDYTVVLFSLVKQLRKAPEAIGKELGEYLIENNKSLFATHNVIKGFLNLSIAPAYWLQFLQVNYSNETVGIEAPTNKRVMVEYSSPNTNKPLHLGHLRNNFLGWSVAEIIKANGNDVIKTCIVNDRGIHICKSMIAWQKFADDATPESTNTKGDHFVGEYYVKFNDEYKKQVEELVAKGTPRDVAEKEAPIMKETQEMLIQWEQSDEDVMKLWREMNGWVYKGFDITYKRIGSDFNKVYYESQTYLLGKDIVEDGLKKGVLTRKDDGSVWIDLTPDGLDEKLVLRKDGTSVYITQDLGLAELKYEEYGAEQSIYVIGDEQNYHVKVLKLIMQKLGAPYAAGMHHLSYGMVELPSGKMKSREGTVVDADDLVDEMISIAKEKTKELGKVEDFTGQELNELHNMIGLGALKFFLLRVDPKKRMIFDPAESIELHGFTGPFIQYTHARIKSILRKEQPRTAELNSNDLLPLEKDVLMHLEMFPSLINEAATELDPSKVAIYIFNLAQLYNSFYTKHKVTNAETEEKKQLRLQLSQFTANVIAKGMSLLGIRVPERM